MVVKMGLVILDALAGSLMLFLGLLVPIFFLAVMLAPLLIALHFAGMAGFLF